MNWERLAREHGPQPSNYHPMGYWKPPAVRPAPFPNGEIEYSNGAIRKAGIGVVRWGERGVEPCDGPPLSYAEHLR